MDLRMVKTRTQIKNAFLALREKLMPDKIKVKDLCEVAMINKTTFYNHYTDTDELSREIDDHAIDMVLSEFSEQKKILVDPRAYVIGLFAALERQSSHLSRVFRGKQDVLCNKLETRLREVYRETADRPEESVRVSFAIGGMIHVVRDYLLSGTKYSIEQLIDSTARLFELLLDKEPDVMEATI